MYIRHKTLIHKIKKKTIHSHWTFFTRGTAQQQTGAQGGGRIFLRKEILCCPALLPVDVSIPASQAARFPVGFAPEQRSQMVQNWPSCAVVSHVLEERWQGIELP